MFAGSIISISCGICSCSGKDKYMKRDYESVERRRAQILKMIREQKSVKVEDLAEIFQMSAMSVRRDLQYLEDRNYITRFYGGAKANAPSLANAEGTYENYRKLLSRYAASKVETGDTIFVNGSTCALGLLDHLDVQNVHVITNNGIAATKKCPKGVTITLTGGELREHVMVGDSVMRRLLNETADKTFIGCAGITANGEFSYNIPMEIGINEAMISRTTKEVYILADHTKLERADLRNEQYGSCIYERQVTLITDEKADPDTVKSLRKKGIAVVQVGLDEVTL